MVAIVETRSINMKEMKEILTFEMNPCATAMGRELAHFTPGYDFDRNTDPREDELYEFGCLFDNTGNLLDDHRGTWDRFFEVETPEILFIDNIKVHCEGMRGKGIGTWALQQVLHHDSFRVSIQFIFSTPTEDYYDIRVEHGTCVLLITGAWCASST